MILRASKRFLLGAGLVLGAATCAPPAGAGPRQDPGGFDPSLFSQGMQLDAGYLWAERWGRPGVNRGIDLAVGGTSQTRLPKPWVLHGSASLAVRALDKRSYSVSLPRHIVAGGIALGPVEPFAGFGFSMLTLDYLEGRFGFGLLSPITTAGVGVKLGPLHLTARGYVEYLWRWTAPDYVVRGISVTLATVRFGPQRTRVYPNATSPGRTPEGSVPGEGPNKEGADER